VNHNDEYLDAIRRDRCGGLSPGGRFQWRLCVLISESLCPRKNWWGVVQSIVAANPGCHAAVDCIQLREKTLGDNELLHRAKRLVALCQPMGICVIINDRPDIAMLSGADGVHLGQGDLSCKDVRQLVGWGRIIGGSTSDLAEAQEAHRDGADYCGVGPMFPTSTKHKNAIVGPSYLRQYLAWGKLPHLAIGGITVDNLVELVALGVLGVAVSSAICCESEPGLAVKQLSQLL